MMKRRLVTNTQESERQECSNTNLSISKMYDGYVYDKRRNTYYRILSSAGNSTDSGFLTNEAVRQIEASQPCPTSVPPRENFSRLLYQQSLRSGVSPRLKDSMVRSRVRCLTLSSRQTTLNYGPSVTTLLQPNERGIFSLFNRTSYDYDVTHQPMFMESGRVKFDTPRQVMSIGCMSEIIWKLGAPQEANETIFLQNAMLGRVNQGISIGMMRFGNGSDIEPREIVRHNMSIKSHTQGLGWCPRREMIIVGSERHSYIFEMGTERTYQLGAQKMHAHQFYEDSLFCGGSNYVHFFDLRKSLKQSRRRIRLSEGSFVKKMKVLPQQNAVLVGCAGGQVTLWDLRLMCKPRTVFDNCRSHLLGCSPLHVDSSERFLTCVDIGHGTHVWDLLSGELLRCLPVEQDCVRSAAFLRDWNALCTFSEEGICTYVLK